VATLAVGRRPRLKFLYLVFDRGMAVNARHAVLLYVSRVHELDLGIPVEFFRLEMTLETSLFPDVSVARYDVVMAVTAVDVPFNDCHVIIPHSCQLVLRLVLKAVARVAVRKFIEFVFGVVRLFKMTVETGGICNLHVRPLHDL